MKRSPGDFARGLAEARASKERAGGRTPTPEEAERYLAQIVRTSHALETARWKRSPDRGARADAQSAALRAAREAGCDDVAMMEAISSGRDAAERERK